MLTADSVRTMFRPHFRPDPRVAGMALGFEPHAERGRVLICKGGTVNGFLSALEMAPEDGVGVVVLTNTGGLDNRGVPEPLAAALTRRLLGLPANPVRDDVAPHPEVWDALRGWYAPDAGPGTNLFARVGFGAGIEVAVRHDRLVLKPLTPVPGLRDAMVLHPDDPDDPRVYRVEFPASTTRPGGSCSPMTRLRDCCSTSCRSRSGPTGRTRAAGPPASPPPARHRRRHPAPREGVIAVTVEKDARADQPAPAPVRRPRLAARRAHRQR